MFRRLSSGHRASDEHRYLAVHDFDRTPPKTWGKQGPTYYASKLTSSSKMKAVGARAYADYLRMPGTWLLLKVQAASAEQARTLVERALKGDELAARRIEVLVDRYGLVKGSPLDKPKPTPAPEPPRFTIGSREKVGTWEGAPERINREDAEELKPGEFSLKGMFFGAYAQAGTDELEGLPGIKMVGEHRDPYQLLSVTTDRIGFAHIPVIAVTALAANPHGGFAVDVARPLAVGFAKAHGLVFDLYSPSVGTRRTRIATDRNPASASFGKQKRMEEVTVHFTVPDKQLGRMTPEQQRWFGYSYTSDRPRWGLAKVEAWLGLDRVEVLEAFRNKRGPRQPEQPARPRQETPAVVPLRPSADDVPSSGELEHDARQVDAGIRWAASKLRSRSGAVTLGTKRMAAARRDKDRAFWYGVRLWGEGRDA